MGWWYGLWKQEQNKKVCTNKKNTFLEKGNMEITGESIVPQSFKTLDE